MKKAILIITVLFLIAVAYVINYSNQEITLKNIASTLAPHTNAKEPATKEITLSDSTKTNNVDKVQIDYYIIVGSFRNLTLAQQKAEKSKNDFNNNIIILPPTTEGYYSVSIGKYSSLEEAKSAIKSVRAGTSSNAWIKSVIK
jgi:septal ring-binding cell division protein DamX